MSDTPTLKQLRERAAELEISGRSSMDQEQLTAAIAAAENAAGNIPHTPVVAEPEPDHLTPPDSGRPPLGDIARERATDTTHRVLDAPVVEGEDQ